MRSKVLVMILLVTVLITSGCLQNSLSVFQKAEERTQKIAKGKHSIDLSVRMELNEGLTAEQQKTFDLFKDVQLKLNQVFDKDQQISLLKMYANVAGMGVDGKLYQRGKDYFVVSPIFPKILLIHAEELQDLVPPDSQVFSREPGLSRESRDKLQAACASLLKQDNVVKLGKIILPTPEGEVKAQKFTIMLSAAELMPVLKEMAQIVLNDESMLENIQKFRPEQASEINKEDLSAECRKLLEEATISHFNYEAFIDRDGYLVEENVKIELKLSKERQNLIKSCNVEMKVQRWDIEKTIKIDFPEINEYNTMFIKDLQQDNAVLPWGKGGQSNGLFGN